MIRVLHRLPTALHVWTLGLFLGAAMLGGGAGLAQGATTLDVITHRVTTLVDTFDGVCDEDNCSLRDAVFVAGDGDIVALLAGTFAFVGIDIPTPITLRGQGAGLTVLDGRGLGRVLDVTFVSGTVTIEGVTITEGSAAGGAGVRVVWRDARLVVRASAVTGNDGDGIASVGHVELDQTTIAGNMGAGVRLASDGGNRRDLTVTASTISGNTGAGLLVEAGDRVDVLNSTISSNGGAGIDLSARQASIIHVTIANNAGSGLVVRAGEGATITVRNTIVAGNAAGDVQGQPLTSLGHNLVGDGSLPEVFAEGGNLSGDPLLGPLVANGGPIPTFTHALQPGSPAIDAGENLGGDGATIDQRGLPRPRDGGSDSAIADIGAFEVQDPPPNLPPVAAADAASTTAGVAVVIDVLVNDSDPERKLDATSVAVVLPPQHGEAVVGVSGAIIYTPEGGFEGLDSFTYLVRDEPGLASAPATVTIDVAAAATGGGDGGGSGGGSGGGVVAGPPPVLAGPATTPAKATLPPGVLIDEALVFNGGATFEASAADGSIVVTIDAASVATLGETRLRVISVAPDDLTSPVPPRTTLAGANAFAVSLEDGSGAVVDRFDPAVTVTLFAGFEGAAGSRVPLLLDGRSGAWEQPASTSVLGRVIFTIDRPGIVGLFEFETARQPLTGGLNAITFTGRTGTTARELAERLGPAVESILRFDAEQGRMQAFVAGAPEFASDLGELRQRDPLFVRVAAGAAVDLVDTELLSPPDGLRTVRLIEGLNVFTMTGARRQGVFDLFAGRIDFIEAVFRFDVGAQRWLQWAPDAPAFVNTLETLKRLDVVVVRALEGFTLTLRELPEPSE